MPIIAAGIIVAALLGGGISMVAQNSVPGDTLYGVKINVNEPMHNAFSFSEKAKAEADLDEAGARVEEANKLSANGKLSAEKKAELMANFDAHVHAASERLARMRANGNTQDATALAAKFTTALSGSLTASATNTASANGSANGNASGNATGSASAQTNASFISHVQSELSNFNSVNMNGSSGTASDTTSTSGSNNASGSTQLNGSVNVNSDIHY